MESREFVTRVIDGDTFETGSNRGPVRLADVDTPERGEPKAKEYTKFLESLILHKLVDIYTVATDRYKRRVAEVEVEGESVNEEVRRELRKLRR